MCCRHLVLDRAPVDSDGARWKIDPLAIARDVFCQSEIAGLEALPDMERTRAFFRGWTRKEALIKAPGDGFSFPVDQFEFTMADDTAAPAGLCGNSRGAKPLADRRATLKTGLHGHVGGRKPVLG